MIAFAKEGGEALFFLRSGYLFFSLYQFDPNMLFSSFSQPLYSMETPDACLIEKKQIIFILIANYSHFLLCNFAGDVKLTFFRFYFLYHLVKVIRKTIALLSLQLQLDGQMIIQMSDKNYLNIRTNVNIDSLPFNNEMHSRSK